MSDNDKVVFLEFRPKDAKTEEQEILACKCCLNKTYTVTYLPSNQYPLLRCSVCGQHIGHIGWAGADED